MTFSHDDESDGIDSLPAPETEYGRLVAAVLAGTATAEDERRLATLLDHPEVGRASLAHLQLSGELRWRWRQPRSGQPENVAAGPQSPVPPATRYLQPHREPPHTATGPLPYWLLATALVIAVAIALIGSVPFGGRAFMQPPRREPATPAAATVAGEVLSVHEIRGGPQAAPPMATYNTIWSGV